MDGNGACDSCQCFLYSKALTYVLWHIMNVKRWGLLTYSAHGRREKVSGEEGCCQPRYISAEGDGEDKGECRGAVTAYRVLYSKDNTVIANRSTRHVTHLAVTEGCVGR